MTKSEGHEARRTDVRVSIIGGHRMGGAVIQERTLTVSLVGGADIDLTDVDIPDGAEIRITKLSLVGGVKLRVRPNVRVKVGGIRLGGVSDEGPSEPGGPTVRVDAWGLVGGVRVERD
ncbi:hypothetical protein [Streptomyces sp. NRRL B-24484]|uniref:hypothetical protein n=1 Tax=Streptomyces sp. NRRL B-24484 TaxID=1463833 RepID=UPI0004BE8EF9|nr:hypothetical protein [Streptomyces sp. NRRL B-24484]